jgi:hypothetical protein
MFPFFKLKGKETSGRPRRIKMHDVKMVVKETGCEGLSWIHLA